MEKTKQTKSTLPAVVAEQQAMVPAVTNLIGKVTRPRPGQPTKRTEAIVEEIVDRIADGESLLAICQDEHLPGYSTFNRWQRADPDLLRLVDLAYEFHARTMDDIIDDMLAGGPSSCGEFRRDVERAAHLRWRLGKLNRRRFGDRQQIEITTYEPVVIDGTIIEGPGGDGV
ncbi:hypothetical protein N6H05_18710 [Sphingobium sp. WTD-1]|uniref:terminase small subunit-like protein n=1 Tax=Sphingobium sp. WTD-1 TaxID=2979467 RepID=UPI0024DEF953|nr:hypothetical protein [Sphingobium sp. WTD-1]WIA55049.1 hypothetical protein N6H05_18710 [Sphingobium sp. WTD-1]